MYGTSPREFHADETSTGARHLVLRGERRIVVAAKTAAGDDFEWVHRLSAACPPTPRGEIKAPELIALAGRSPEANKVIQSATEHYSIFVIDLFHRYRGVIRMFATAAGVDADQGTNTLHRLLGSDAHELAQRLLMRIKEALVDFSLIGHVERMARSVCPGGLVDGKLFDREALLRMSSQEFIEAVARMQILLSEVLDPDVHERALADMWWKQRLYCSPGEMDTRVLSVVVGDSHVYDNGRVGAFQHVKDAQSRLAEVIQKSIWSPERVQIGGVSMDDSTRVAGIRAADVATRIAAEMIETDYRDTYDAVRRLRARFRQVFLNGSLGDF